MENLTDAEISLRIRAFVDELGMIVDEIEKVVRQSKEEGRDRETDERYVRLRATFLATRESHRELWREANRRGFNVGPEW